MKGLWESSELVDDIGRFLNVFIYKSLSYLSVYIFLLLNHHLSIK